MAVCKIDADGFVLQRWLDVKNLNALTEKYGLSGPEYVEGKPNRGDVYVDGAFVRPPPAIPSPEEVLAEWRENASCSRAQGKLAIGPEVWGQVVAMLDDPETPWGLRVAVDDTPVWNRNNEDMAALIWAMGLTDEEADDLFRLAATL